MLGRPKTLAGQLTLLVALALLVAQAVNAGLLFKERSARTLEAISAPAVARIIDAAERVSATPGEIQRRVGRAQITIASAVRGDMKPLSRVARRIAGRLSESEIQFEDVRVAKTDSVALRESVPRFVRGRIPEDRPLVLVSAKLVAGPWINIFLPAPPSDQGLLGQIFLQTVILYVVVLLAVLWIGRYAARSLNRLTRAVTDVGATTGGTPAADDDMTAGPADMRELVEAFNDMRRRITGMLAEKDRMIGAIGHDLRTPLASLRLRAEGVPDEVERGEMVRTIKELDTTLDDILMLARFRQSSELPGKVDVGELVDAVAEDFRALGAEIDVAPFSRIVAKLRPTLTRRALRNVIDNAIKYGGRARINVMTEDGFALVVVEDEGPGIDAASLERVFEDFERLEDSRNRGTGGSGLGLSLAREIIHSQDGRISLENRDAGGLRASIYLPLA